MSQNRIEELEKKLAVAERRINRLIELQTNTTLAAINYRCKYYEIKTTMEPVGWPSASRNNIKLKNVELE